MIVHLIIFGNSCHVAVAAFTWRLKEETELIIILTFICINMCVKNCEDVFAMCISKVGALIILFMQLYSCNDIDCSL